MAMKNRMAQILDWKGEDTEFKVLAGCSGN